MWLSTFQVKHLDCPCEESLIRMKMESIEGIIKQEYDIAGRTFRVYHRGDVLTIEASLSELNLGSKLMESVALDGSSVAVADDTSDRLARKTLIWVLAINLTLFVVEVLIGWFAKSMGLIADSLDMLADASVYGLSLWAIGATSVAKRRVARWAGYLQIVLALIGLLEVVRRSLGLEDMPEVSWMLSTALLAFFGNSLCLWLLQRTQSHEAHIRASLIFSSNDVIINLGLILAGGLVWLTGSPIPDLLIGLVVFVLVCHGAWRILRLS